MIRLSWAASLYGVQSMASWLGTASRIPEDPAAPRVPESPAWSTRNGLGEPERLAFQAGDEIQEELQEWLRGRMDPRSWTPANLLDSGAQAWGLSRRLLEGTAPGREGLALRLEWRNRLRVYRWVRKARSLSRAGSPDRDEGSSLDLGASLAAEERQPRQGSLWIVEGLAHDWAYGLEEHSPGALGIVLQKVLRALPERFLLPVHAGTGLALAERVLQDLSPGSPARDFRAALDQLEGLAREAAAPGFEAAILESFGLVARCFFPPLMAPLDRQLVGRPGDLRHLFWHGAGRAQYFLPLQLVPGVGTAQRALERSQREAPDRASRRDSLGGLAWAFAAVNSHSPVVLECFLERHGAQLSETPFETAFREAVLFLHRSAPEASPAPALLRHRPADAAGGPLWQRWILEPLAAGLRDATHQRPAVAGYAAGLALEVPS